MGEKIDRVAGGVGMLISHCFGVHKEAFKRKTKGFTCSTPGVGIEVLGRLRHNLTRGKTAAGRLGTQLLDSRSPRFLHIAWQDKNRGRKGRERTDWDVPKRRVTHDRVLSPIK